MKHRSPAAVFLLSLITFGIYAIVWHVKTKNELNKLGAEIPTAWLLIVPLANLYWVWKYSEGVEKVTNGKISAVLALILLLLLSIVGLAILQSQYNSLNLQPAAASPVPGNPGAVPTSPIQGGPTETVAPVTVSPTAPAAPQAPLAPITPTADTPTAPTPPPVGTPVFPTTPPVPPTVNDPAPPIQPPATPPNLPPSPIQ